MPVIPRYVEWRWIATRKIAIAGTFTVNPNLGGFATILRAAGDFIADGVKVGMTVMPVGSSNVDGYRYLVTPAWVGSGAQATVLLCDAIVGGAGDGPEAFKLVVYQQANDGYEEYPGLSAGEAGRTNLVRAGGFNGGFTNPNGGGPLKLGSTISATVNAGAADAVAGVPEYDWYLSQRTDDPVKQYLTCVQKTDNSGNTYSGSVDMAPTQLAATELAVVNEPTIDQLVQLLRFCDLYCRRRSDGAIQWVSLLRATLGAV